MKRYTPMRSPNKNETKHKNNNTDDFVTVWRLEANDELRLFINNGATVDWGDGSKTTVKGDDNVKNTYFYAGDYEVRISNTLTGMVVVPHLGTTDKLIDVKQWGTATWYHLYAMFENCSNMTMSATDAPNLSQVMNIGCLFEGCSKFNSPVNHWDVRQVSLMHNTFYGATLFNQDLTNWRYPGYIENGVFKDVLRNTSDMFGPGQDLDSYFEAVDANAEKDKILAVLSP